jgi:hypothetical protein
MHWQQTDTNTWHLIHDDQKIARVCLLSSDKYLGEVSLDGEPFFLYQSPLYENDPDILQAKIEKIAAWGLAQRNVQNWAQEYIDGRVFASSSLPQANGKLMKESYIAGATAILKLLFSMDNIDIVIKGKE